MILPGRNMIPMKILNSKCYLQNHNRRCITICICIIFSLLLSGLFGCRVFAKEDNRKDYGVFLSLDASDLDKIAEYQTVVIDAQHFSKKDIAALYLSITV